MQKLYIGLDISTTTIGYSSLLIDNLIIKDIKYSYYKPNKKVDKIEMIYQAKQYIANFIKEQKEIYKLDPKICIEDILLFTNKTTARTITILSAINRVICIHAYETYNKNIQLMPVATIRANMRKIVGASQRIDKSGIPNTIEIIMQKHQPGWKFSWECITKGKTKGKYKEENYDAADSLAVAFACAFKNKDI